MKAFLMYHDRDFSLSEPDPKNAPELTQDLDLQTLFAAMADGDDFLLGVVKKAVLSSLREPEAIAYRQQILTDCLQNPTILRELYGVAVEGFECDRKVWGSILGRTPEGVLYRSVELLQLFVSVLKQLKRIAQAQMGTFRSEGFLRFFQMIASELTDEYLARVEDHLERLKFRDGMLISAELGEGNKGDHYVLRKPPQAKHTWTERIQTWMEDIAHGNGSKYRYEIADRDEAGLRALSDLKSYGISSVAAALAESTNHILTFFTMLRLELAFYAGCLKLHERLAAKGEPTCFPTPLDISNRKLSTRGLYDVSLAVSVVPRAIGNDLLADNKLLVMITGANRGGKSTFLRSIGLAQLMMQCGMFVAAESFQANVCDGVFTHFKREEDATMKSGKFDEELSRMSKMIDRVSANSLILLNESFASTNEREGSEIAMQILRALLEPGIKVFYVTHLFDLAHRVYLSNREDAVFLRAERLGDGKRTFRLLEGEPLPTSYGEDLYRRIFGTTETAAKSRTETSTAHAIEDL